MVDSLPVYRPHNHMQTIIQEFLEGVPFAESLCDRVALTYSMDTSAAGTLSYKRELEFIKHILNRAKHRDFHGQVYVIDADYEFSDLESALIIRLLNICHHNSFIIVLNGKIIYIPKELRRYTEEEVRLSTHRIIEGAKPSYLNNLWSKLTNSLRRKRDKPHPFTMELITA